MRAEDVIFSAERPDGGIKRKNESIATKVGVDFGFPVAFRVQDDAKARRPHVIEDLGKLVANQTLLFPAQAEVHRQSAPQSPRIVYVGGVVFPTAPGDTAVKTSP